MHTSLHFASADRFRTRTIRETGRINQIRLDPDARSEGLIVVTNNMREFARMPGVRAENWI